MNLSSNFILKVIKTLEIYSLSNVNFSLSYKAIKCKYFFYYIVKKYIIRYGSLHSEVTLKKSSLIILQIINTYYCNAAWLHH
jgi:hypothetical protein